MYIYDWCFWTMVLEKTLESPLDCKEIKPFNSKGNQSWIFIEKTDADAEAETPILVATGCDELTHWKSIDAEKDWRWEKKGVTEDEMVRCHHQINKH